MASKDLVVGLLPVLGRSVEPGFNVFDVMHHGLHEKQLSNFFRWLLESDGTHGFGDRFVRIFLDEVNAESSGQAPLPTGDYWVRQEVNTSVAEAGADIADLVLESTTTVIVIENYIKSDGHGHNYHGYLSYAERNGRRGRVVLLCRDRDSSLQTHDWDRAAVLTYGTLLSRLYADLDADRIYQKKHPQAFSFIEQAHRKFVTRKGFMNDDDVLGFVIAMCETGEARRYQEKNRIAAAERLASDLADQARERFGEGRDLLQRAKTALRAHCAGPLAAQLNQTLGEGAVGPITTDTGGIYQWTVNFSVEPPVPGMGRVRLQLKFGPSAWYANEQDVEWARTVDPSSVDYSRLLLTRIAPNEIYQSAVALHEVLDGLDANDIRLHDEIITLVSGRYSQVADAAAAPL
jgi:hypothetical protein